MPCRRGVSPTSQRLQPSPSPSVSPRRAAPSRRRRLQRRSVQAIPLAADVARDQQRADARRWWRRRPSSAEQIPRRRLPEFLCTVDCLDDVGDYPRRPQRATDRTHDEYPRRSAPDRFHRNLASKVHRASRRLDQHAVLARDDGCGTASPRDQAHPLKNCPAQRNPGIGGLVEDHAHVALDDAVEAVRVVVARRFLAGLGCAHVGVEHEFAQLQRRDLREQVGRAFFCTRTSASSTVRKPGRAANCQQRFVGRLDLAAENVFDDLVALVHRLFDQRIPGESADDVETLHVRFVLRADRRAPDVGSLFGNVTPQPSTKPRARHSEARDHAVDQYLRLAVLWS